MLPDIPYKSGAARIPITQFGGLERRVGAGNGTIADMVNLTGRDAPVLSSRPRRKRTSTLANPRGIYAVGSTLFWVNSGKLFKDNNEVVVDSLPASANRERIFAAMGKRLVIWPDKILVNVDDGTAENLEASYARSGMVFSDGTYAGEPAEKNTITTDGAAFPFNVGDAITIPACAPTGNAVKYAVVQEKSADGKVLRFYENTFDANGTVSASLTLKREVPDFDFICANDNRLWGCKGDTVWCSKLGDPKNWYALDLISTNAWSVETGTPGDFTGCISFMGYPVFFKEERVFKVYGNRPGNYELMSSATLGVIPGAAKTMAIAGETLYYLSRAGFVRYNGGYPSSVDAALNAKYIGGAAGSDGKKYFVSALRSDNVREFLVFDPETGLWFKEDDLAARGMANVGNTLYAQTDNPITSSPTNYNFIVSGAEDPDEAAFSASVTLADFDLQTFGSKYPVRLWLRYESAGDVTVHISYNGGTMESVTALPATDKAARYIPVPIRRCDRFSVKLSGNSAWKLYALEIETRAETTNRKGG